MNKPIYPQVKVEKDEPRIRLTTYLRKMNPHDGLYYLIKHITVYTIPFNIPGPDHFDAIVKATNILHEEVYKSLQLYVFHLALARSLDGSTIFELDNNQQSEIDRIKSIYTRIEHKMNLLNENQKEILDILKPLTDLKYTEPELFSLFDKNSKPCSGGQFEDLAGNKYIWFPDGIANMGGHKVAYEGQLIRDTGIRFKRES